MQQESDGLRKLSPEALVVFAQGLAGLPADEVRKLKRLYVKNTVAELRAEIAEKEAQFQAGCIHWMIPLFWPFAYAQRRSIQIAKERGAELLLNVVEAWQDDLQGLDLDLSFLDVPRTEA